MTYVAIFAACLDGAHERCRPVQGAPGAFVYGGGRCICPCHGVTEEGPWVAETRKRSEREREDAEGSRRDQ